MRALRGERGQASLELLGVLPLLVLVAMLMWQLHLAASTSTTVRNAARTASRALGLEGDARKAALASLPPSRRQDAEVHVRGERVTVKVKVPIIVKGIDTPLWTVRHSAELPDT